ncbi:MAG TPA: phasin family protein [Thermoanaerobaculia bacterium]|jgi:poly(hydroxyalkanoate) granule-associated protein
MSEAHVDRNEGFGRLFAAGRSLWLAGLGVMAEVEEESRELFSRLVERGRPVDERQKKAAEAVAGRATRTAREFGKLLQDTVEYESRGMLERLNVMTREDVKVLSARLETLSRKIDEYAARRQASLVEPVEIVTPQGEAAAIVIPETPTAAASAQAPRPRQRTTTTR